jgi:N-(2-amino-2-carboxyethyl)-L-glutamate synthase
MVSECVAFSSCERVTRSASAGIFANRSNDTVKVITTAEEFHVEDLFLNLNDMVGRDLFLKCEGFNFAGSIKLKPAIEMITALEREGRIDSCSVLVESSSGNLGVALAVVAAARGYSLVCVMDCNSNRATRKIIEVLGASVIVVDTPDPVTGWLGARFNQVRDLCQQDARCVWLNQHANRFNWMSHYWTTAPAVERCFPDLGVLFVGVGTSGTLMGCGRYFKERSPGVTIVAVDAVGSATFGGKSGPRLIPGLGASVRPLLLDDGYLDDVVHVEEAATIAACRSLAARGFLFGGSTGTVVAGAQAWLQMHGRPGLRCVAIAPDLGDRYIETIYDDAWVDAHFGELADTEPTGHSAAISASAPDVATRELSRVGGA